MYHEDYMLSNRIPGHDVTYVSSLLLIAPIDTFPLGPHSNLSLAIAAACVALP